MSRIPENMRLLNQIYGFIQAEKCLFNIICDDRFRQSEADRRVFHKFDDGEEVEMVVFVHVDDILAHAQATMGGSLLSLEARFEVKSMVEKFGVEKAGRTPASLGVSTFFFK